MSDLRSAIQGAISNGTIEAPAPAAPSPAPVESAPVAAPAQPAAAPSVQRDESGRFAPKGDAKEAPVAAAPTTATAPKYKPPQSWKPAIREKWASLPEDVQEEVDRREREMTARLSKADSAERGLEGYRRALTPFEAQLKASGKAVPEALADALSFAARVRNGSPQERAAALADVIAEAAQAGVGVEAIDVALAQRLGGQAQTQPPKPAEFRDPRFDQFLAQIQQRERAKVAQTVSDFAAKHEFFADVQDDVAGLMEAGIAKDLETAYDYAVALPKHEEIGKVLAQRKAAESARTGSPATERAVQAASSVRASPVVASPASPRDLRSMIQATLAKS